MKFGKTWRVCGLTFWMVLIPLTGANVEDREIPFQLKEHYIVVKGALGDQQDLNLVIDTGATFTYVSPDIARKLRLESDRGSSVAMGRKVKIRRVILDRVQIGPLTFRSTEARVARLPFVRKFRIDGLIGLNLLRHLNLIIDFQSKKLILNPSEPLLNSQAFNANLPFILARFKIGGVRASLLLDTGAEDFMIFNTEELQWQRTGGTKYLNHVGGRARLRAIMLSDVALAGTSWEKLSAYVADVSPKAYGGLDGIVGLTSLGVKRFQLDFPNARFGWER
ncbi:MAG: aspartyl protease family protein [Acidobacteriota bacterium]